MRQPILVLTATINPRADVRDLMRRSGSQRRHDYVHALARWIELVGDRWRILLVENSGYDLISDDRFAHPLVELLSVPAVDSDQKGVGEAVMLDAVLDLLALNGVHRRTVVVKCTGRLVVPNGPKIVRPDAMGVQAMLRADGTYLDSRFVAADLRTWRDHLGSLADDVDEGNGRFLEHVLAERVAAAGSAGTPFLPFRRLPAHEGHSATTGRSYSTPWLRTRRHGHDLLKRVAPRWCVYR